MTLDELERLAKDGGPHIVLHLPQPNSRGYTRRLAGRHGPRGEIVCGNDKGQVVRFLSADVLRFVKQAKTTSGERT